MTRKEELASEMCAEDAREANERARQAGEYSPLAPRLGSDKFGTDPETLNRVGEVNTRDLRPGYDKFGNRIPGSVSPRYPGDNLTYDEAGNPNGERPAVKQLRRNFKVRYQIPMPAEFGKPEDGFKVKVTSSKHSAIAVEADAIPADGFVASGYLIGVGAGRTQVGVKLESHPGVEVTATFEWPNGTKRTMTEVFDVVLDENVPTRSVEYDNGDFAEFQFGDHEAQFADPV